MWRTQSSASAVQQRCSTAVHQYNRADAAAVIAAYDLRLHRIFFEIPRIQSWAKRSAMIQVLCSSGKRALAGLTSSFIKNIL